ncbi:Protein phosphatase 2C 7 [Exophiala xenobiotica]|uniref:Protein phosphatase n=1 Tax=Vermiconidia calcicola TaxID=1690605 RepID=A0AAV9QMG5_9PEZI|nr:Protein phosphatase 2C 7 [Exophiala xenobiotica]KAK5545828.1 Protein phosphatase 2C 7 [Vermiconidia calcicola]KAK5549911.1 Protein phosphatase 2C 7 [Chaetothyriales sp. CCFEE 6169]KAK5199225.1 Protein phosphatase 2C 7 [Exophiala xenobiotica]KAK5229792.1 Protein phosphatase 2C 7 [Exophiala xenobiotica]
MTSAAPIRTPAFLTRSLIFTPSHINHRAGKSSRRDPALAYRVLLALKPYIRRGLDPYKPHARSLHSSPRRAAAATANSTANTASSAIPHISLHIAASSSGKGRKFRPESSTFDYIPSNTDGLGHQQGSTIEEKKSRRPDSGQDAYFVARVGQDSDITAFGVADGVGGWTDHGIDPADFSHGLCSHMLETALSWSQEERLGPRQLLEIGYDKVKNDPAIRAGGTTACVAVSEPDGRMRIANLGDSGFLQLRLGTVHHYSNPQTHAFNTPYQLSMTPPEILAQAMIFGGMPLADEPEKADLADHMLRHGDVLVLGTDGVWDNLNSQDILSIVSKQMRRFGAWLRSPDQGYSISPMLPELVDRSLGPQKHKLPGTLQSVLAAAIVGEAKAASLSAKRDGPFAKEMQKHFPYDPWHGGKVDDIAVLVVIPVDQARAREDKASLKPKL